MPYASYRFLVPLCLGGGVFLRAPAAVKVDVLLLPLLLLLLLLLPTTDLGA
jgi:hypothetical protein